MVDCYCLCDQAKLVYQFLVRRFFSPHFWLVVSCIFYIAFGSWIFQILEGRNLQHLRDTTLENVNGAQDKYMEVVWKKAMERTGQSVEEAVQKIIEETKEEFGEYVDTVHSAQRVLRHGSLDGAPSWDFKNSLIFTATMLTSIGYGYVVPVTNSGRLFVVIYCLIGIPLTLLTVANIAKFISETIFLVHYELWKIWMRWKQKGKDIVVEDSRDMFNDSEDEQDILDRVQLVRFPPLAVFLFVFLYGLFGAFIIQRNESWSYTDSLYFTFISILTVGFGDMRPTGEHGTNVALVVTGGIILTTMCMDVVGRMYLKEIHYLGRKLQTSNPFYLIREAKARRRRQAMASLLAQLAKGMIFAHRNYSELARKKSKINRNRKRGSHVLPDGQFMFARLPPDPPSDCQVVSTSAYSVRLAWAPAFSTDAPVTYNIRYRLKYSQQKGDNKVRELKGIQGNTAEIMSLDSCSLYEFRITAVSKNGESKPVILVQYTEPQLSPQHILATRLHANTIELTWEPPYKRTGDVKNYMVYWTDNPSARLADWEKVTVYGRKVVFPDLKYDWFYMFSANACFIDGQRSPLSRALFVKTEKLEFNRLHVGHSKTVEVMEALKENECDETTPLIKRDYASFAA
uniref:TWiK family of potassium channels protein 7 n=1 Tax=Steinernema glaseri TaxID=37863 RepID=A0A1I7YKZ4_9BILA